MGIRSDDRFNRLKRRTATAAVAGLIRVPSGLRIGALALTGLIFFLIALGGLVRNAGAGLSCPDWPLCFGRVVPPMNVQVFLEWFHRLIAGSVSTILLAGSAYIFSRRDLRSRFGTNASLALGLLGAQIVLGGMTVLGLLSPKWVSSHLAVGQAFFGTILWLTLRLNEEQPTELRLVPKNDVEGSQLLRLLAPLAAVAVYAQIILGGLVSSNYAGLACLDFPTCNGQWVPVLDGLVVFQFAHRLGALFATMVIFALCVAGAAAYEELSARARGALKALPVLVGIQILLGAGAVIFKLPLPMSVAHLGTAAALFGTLLVMNYEVRSR